MKPYLPLKGAIASRLTWTYNGLLVDLVRLTVFVSSIGEYQKIKIGPDPGLCQQVDAVSAA